MKSIYSPQEIEKKWQKKWQEAKIYSPDLNKAEKPFYNLMMFPYPSAEGMHVGNMYAFTGADVYGRFMRMKGFDVFEPIGLDGFGIHSENYAMKVGRHPKEQAKLSEENFYRQLHEIGNSFDWTRTVETYKPEYYRWTQWIFIQLFKAGLAYKKKAPVNFCPKDLTVLADEQVIDGKCERCGSEVEKKELEQWFFRITKYAQRLLDNIEGLNWTEKVKIAQRNWIGRSEGSVLEFEIIGLDRQIKENSTRVKVFTTRPDTLFGATFLVLSPENKILEGIDQKEVKGYIQKHQSISNDNKEKEKTGVFTGLFAINPVNKEKIPVWVSDYVLAGYGTGAIMAVPAHDQRDFDFAKKYDLPIKEVIQSSESKSKSSELPGAYVGEGKIVNSGEWNGWEIPKDLGKVIDWLEKKGIGKREINFHLRDWLISRQRYWGPPIPLVYCPACAEASAAKENAGWQPVADEDLPVLLPDVKDWKPEGEGTSPLAKIPGFVNTICPNCKGPAKRETDVSDTFLDSAWYFFRYISTEFKNSAFDNQRVKKWMPVNMYIGGAEHSVLHLLYSRFLTMVFKDLGLIGFEEPYSRFYAHGLIIKDGVKMSKSKGNVIIPDAYIGKYGADTLRMYLMFLGPFSQGGDFRDSGIEGMNRFLKRVWKLISENANSKSDIEALQMMNRIIKKVSGDFEELRYNTAIAGLMEWYNFLAKRNEMSKEEADAFLKLLAPFAPHMTEELWEMVGTGHLPHVADDARQNLVQDLDESASSLSKRLHGRGLAPKNKQTAFGSSASGQVPAVFQSIHVASWPSFDEKLIEEKETSIAVSVNGKMRDVLKIESSKINDREFIEQLAKESDKVKKYLENKKILKTIYVAGKVVNFVIS